MTVIAYAGPDEREEVAQFMNTVFTRAKWDIDGWRRLVAGRWCGPNGRYAITVRDAGKLVGVLGLIYAVRQTEAGPRVIADMTSWYILRPYRAQGVGQKMLALATADPDVTVSNFSSAKAAVSVLTNAGFQVLDAERLVWRSGHGAGVVVAHDDPASVGQGLTAKDKQIIADHEGLKVRPVRVETPDGPLLMMIYPQKKHDEYVTHEVMYLSDQALFAQHAPQIAGAVLPVREAILSLDRRFAIPGLQHDEVHAFATPRFYFAGPMAKSEIDMLYSECLLLNIKIH
ncbi:MAG: hypothetical protein AAF307_13235 [Pseudomonadota bacterium]